MSEVKLTISQILAHQNIITGKYDTKLIDVSKALHYNTDHVWTQFDVSNDDICYRGRCVAKLSQDKIFFLDTTDQTPYQLTGNQIVKNNDDGPINITIFGTGKIIYVHPDGSRLWTSCENFIKQYDKRDNKYVFTNTVNFNYRVQNDNYLLSCHDKFYSLLDLHTMNVSVLPVLIGKDPYFDVSHNIFGHITESEYTNGYIYFPNLAIDRNIFGLKLNYFTKDGEYSADMSPDVPCLPGGSINYSVIDNKLIAYCTGDYEDFKGKQYLSILNLKKYISPPHLSCDDHILCQNNILIPVNRSKLRKVPLYESKSSFQGYEDQFELQYRPEVVAVFVDLLHYDMITNENINVLIELLHLCDYTRYVEYNDMIYDQIYYSCIEDVEQFKLLLDIEEPDRVVYQIILDVYLIHYQYVEIDGDIMKQALMSLSGDNNYEVKTSHTTHYFVKDKGIPQLYDLISK